MLVSLEQLVQLGHTLRLPAGEGHIILFSEVQNVLCHSVVVILDHILFIEQRSRAVAHFVEQIGAGPVKNRHKVIADHLYAILGEVTDALLIIFDVHIPGGQTDLNVIVDIDRFHHIAIEAVGVELIHHFLDLCFLPNFAGHFVMQRPYDGGHTGDLLDVRQFDLVISLAIPAKTHLHWHKISLRLIDFLYYSPLFLQYQ